MRRTTRLLAIFTLVLGGSISASPARAAAGDVAPSTRGNDPSAAANHRPVPGVQGALGLPHLATAEVGPSGSARLGLRLEGFAARDFLVPGHRQSRTAATLSLGYTPLRWLELYAATAVSSAATTSQPELLQVMGDSALGAKAVGVIGNGMSLGLDLRLLAGPGVGSQTLGAFGVSPRLLFGFDVPQAGGDTPLRLHLMAGARAGTTGGAESAGYSPYETYALGLHEGTALLAGAGAEVPLPWVTPFVSWRMESRVGDAAGAGGAAQVLGLGARLTAVRALSFTVALDLGISGTGSAETLPAAPPWSVTAGLAYAFAPNPPPPRPVVVTEPVPVERGRLAGEVRSAEDGQPLEGALVSVEAEGARPAATDAEGRFRTHELPPGRVQVTVRAPGHAPLRLTALVRETGETHLAVRLAPEASEAERPAPAPVPAPAASDTRTVAAAPAPVPSRPAGPARASAPAKPRPKRPKRAAAPTPTDVALRGDRLELARPVRFAPGSAVLLADSRALLDQVVAAVRLHGVRRLRVEGHTDGEGPEDANLALSQARAEAVRRHLLEGGLTGVEIEAVGYGESRPLAPNLTRRGREMNRRVELHVLARGS